MKLICPNTRCMNHHGPPEYQWYDYHGSYKSSRGIIGRYRCRVCRKTFSERSLSIDYWAHTDIGYEKLMTLLVSGFSVRGLSRYFGTSTKVIQNRISRLARGAIVSMGRLQQNGELTESLVADGLENYCVSQDFPNNIHLLVGKKSQVVYGFNYALMRRKGRKTEDRKSWWETMGWVKTRSNGTQPSSRNRTETFLSPIRVKNDE